MKKILHSALVVLLTMVCQGAFAQTTFDFDNDYATLFPTLKGTSSGSGSTAVTDGDFTEATTSTAVDGITVTVSESGASTANRIWSSSPRLRMYGGTFTVTAPAGENIAQIDFDAHSSNFNLSTTTGTLTGRTWTGNANSVVFDVAKNTQIRTITVTLASDNVVVAPTIEGTTPFDGETEVTIEAAAGAEIYYTTDGTDPTTSSTLYTGAFKINATTTVKAIAVVDGKSSSVAEKTFTKIELITIAQAQAADEGTVCTVDGQVVATTARGFLLADETGYIYYFAGSQPKNVEGDELIVSGAVSAYGGFNQFTSDATITKTGSSDFDKGVPETMDGAALDAWMANPSIKYVSLTGTLSISGSYYNIDIAGATAIGSVVYPTDELKALLSDGQTLVFTGYLVYTSGSNKYANMIVTSVSDTSGIDSVTAGKQLDENAPVYNLAGQRVSKNTKGILIQNGKKFIK